MSYIRVLEKRNKPKQQVETNNRKTRKNEAKCLRKGRDQRKKGEENLQRCFYT